MTQHWFGISLILSRLFWNYWLLQTRSRLLWRNHLVPGWQLVPRFVGIFDIDLEAAHLGFCFNQWLVWCCVDVDWDEQRSDRVKSILNFHLIIFPPKAYLRRLGQEHGWRLWYQWSVARIADVCMQICHELLRLAAVAHKQSLRHTLSLYDLGRLKLWLSVARMCTVHLTAKLQRIGLVIKEVLSDFVVKTGHRFNAVCVSCFILHKHEIRLGCL